jgi:hypothetical protein
MLLYLARYTDLSRVSGVSGFGLQVGPESCVALPDCGGALSGYALASHHVVGDHMPLRLVGYGERIRRGEYYVYNGGIDSVTAMSSCLGATGSARIAIWKAPGG